MTNKNNNQEKKYTYKFIQFTVSEEDKNQIEEYTEKAGLNTISEFIRQAINEKIIRMDQGDSILEKDSKLIQKIESLLSSQSLEQKRNLDEINRKIDENKRYYQELMTNFELVQKYINKEHYNDITEKIHAFIVEHESVKQQEVMDQFNLSKDDSLKILSNKDYFNYDLKTARFQPK
ncbi:MAG: ribbon-helix-helix domain-containing protein [Candidatus Odinarchaeota archaeon]